MRQRDNVPVSRNQSLLDMLVVLLSPASSVDVQPIMEAALNGYETTGEIVSLR